MGDSAFWAAENEQESAWSMRRKSERAGIHALGPLWCGLGSRESSKSCVCPWGGDPPDHAGAT